MGFLVSFMCYKAGLKLCRIWRKVCPWSGTLVKRSAVHAKGTRLFVVCEDKQVVGRSVSSDIGILTSMKGVINWWVWSLLYSAVSYLYWLVVAINLIYLPVFLCCQLVKGGIRFCAVMPVQVS